ncbi:putative death-receptor fusion protein-domain-containing protein [Globomyces pollinis-pini]|nr:putative death-receptor fusion protein-domain-containing protein [Globomyces pollinis-pini]
MVSETRDNSNHIQINEESIDNIIGLFLSLNKDFDRVYRNSILQKLKRYYKQDTLLWEKIQVAFGDITRSVTVLTEFEWNQFNIVLSLFLDWNQGIHIVESHYQFCLAIFLNQIKHWIEKSNQSNTKTIDFIIENHNLNQKEFLLLLKTLVSFLLKCKNPLEEKLAEKNVGIENYNLLRFCLVLLDSKLDMQIRLLASILVATLISFHMNQSIFYTLDLLLEKNNPDNTLDLEDDNNLIMAHTRNNPESCILIIGGLLQCNPITLVQSLNSNNGVTSHGMLLVFDSINNLMNNHAETQIQSFAIQALSRWFQIVKDGSIELLTILSNSDIIENTLTFIIDKWEDSILSQKRLKEIFDHIVLLVLVNPIFDQQLSRILKVLSKVNPLKKSKFDLLSYLLQKVKVQLVLDHYPNIIHISFGMIEKFSINLSVIGLLNQLIKNMIKEKLPLDAMYPLIIEGLVSESVIIRRSLSERLLPTMAKISPASFNILVSQIQVKSSVWKLEALLSIFRASNTVGFVLEISKDEAQFKSILKSSITAPNLVLQLHTLHYVTESVKSVTQVSQQEIELVKLFWIANHNLLEADTRSQAMSLIGRFMERIKRSIYKDIRDINNLEKKLQKLPEQKDSILIDIGTIETAKSIKFNFFEWVYQVSLIGLFPGGTFKRTVASISLLSVHAEVDQLPIDKALTKSFALLDINDSKYFRIVLAQIMYGNNRDNMLELLEHFKFGSIPMFECKTLEYAKSLVSLCAKLFPSLRAADLDACAALCRFIYIHYVKGLSYLLSFESSTDILDPTRCFVESLLTVLKSHLNQAKVSIIVASKSFPLYGVIDSLVNVLVEVDLADNTLDIEMWKNLLITIADLCIESCGLCSKICADASPEGNLPMSGEETIVDNNYLAQIVLRHCFRTIKESTACLIQVVNMMITLETDSTKIHLFLKHVGETLAVLITSLRHRGAFAAVESNFVTLCRTLSNLNGKESQNLPFEWLKSFLNQISTSEVSVTRRSAGLPPAILAIITSPSDNALKSQRLRYTLDHIFDIITAEVVTRENTDLAQVHAMNVLRILVTDSELSFIIRDHLEKSFEICILQFSSPYFPIRNCATMLFSALVNKSFGNKKPTQDFDNINAITGREFFSKFPNLHGILYDRLQNAVQCLEKDEIHPLLYPLLSLLSRAKPIADDTLDSVHSLIPFENLVIKCCKAVQWKVREISSRSLASLIDSSRLFEVLGKLMVELKTVTSANHIHGIALQVFTLLEFHWSEYSSKLENFNRLAELLEPLHSILLTNHYSVARGVFQKSLHFVFFNNSTPVSDSIDKIKSNANQVACAVLSRKLTLQYCPTYHIETYCQISCSKKYCESNSGLIESLFDQGSNTVIAILLETLHRIPSDELCTYSFFNSLVNILLIIFQDVKTDYYRLTTIAVKLLCQLPSLEKLLQIEWLELITIWLDMRIPFDLIESLLHLTTRLVIIQPDPKMLGFLFSKALVYMNPSYPHHIRLSISSCLDKLKSSITTSDVNFVNMALCLDQLMVDEEEEVRDSGIPIATFYLQSDSPKCSFLSRLLFHQLADKFLYNNGQWIDYNLNRFYQTTELFPTWVDKLFDAEALNDYKEDLIDIVQNTNSIIRMFSLNRTINASRIERLVTHTERILGLLEDRSNLEFETNTVETFTGVAECIGCSHILNTLGMPQYLERIRKLHIHPVLEFFSTDLEYFTKHILGSFQVEQ